MPRVRLDIATEEISTEREATDIRIDTDVFRTLSGDRTTHDERPPTIFRWLDRWRR